MYEHQIEVKIELKKDNIEKILRNNNAVFVYSGKEVIYRYDTENKMYEKEGKFIRLNSGIQNTLTVQKKRNVIDDKYLQRTKCEVNIIDFEKQKEILEFLDLKVIGKMEKYCEKWLLENVELSVDILPFGKYIKAIGEKEQIERVLKKLGFESNQHIGITYWEIYNQINNNKSETNENIVFGGD